MTSANFLQFEIKKQLRLFILFYSKWNGRRVTKQNQIVDKLKNRANTVTLSALYQNSFTVFVYELLAFIVREKWNYLTPHVRFYLPC